MSLLLQVPMTTSTGGTVLENYSVGDVLIWKANRGKLPELVTLIESYQADVNYRNQVRTTCFLAVQPFLGGLRRLWGAIGPL